MQGTVAEFDSESRSGVLLLDDGQRVEFEAAAFDASGLRLLRLGQRVRIEYAEGDAEGDAEGGEVTRVTLPTMPAE